MIIDTLKEYLEIRPEYDDDRATDVALAYMTKWGYTSDHHVEQVAALLQALGRNVTADHLQSIIDKHNLKLYEMWGYSLYGDPMNNVDEKDTDPRRLAREVAQLTDVDFYPGLRFYNNSWYQFTDGISNRLDRHGIRNVVRRKLNDHFHALAVARARYSGKRSTIIPVSSQMVTNVIEHLQAYLTLEETGMIYGDENERCLNFRNVRFVGDRRCHPTANVFDPNPIPHDLNYTEDDPDILSCLSWNWNFPAWSLA